MRRCRAPPDSGAPQRDAVLHCAPRTITWSKFRIYAVADSDLDNAEARPFPHIAGAMYQAVSSGITEPACQVNFEGFLAGPDIEWFMSHDEVHHITSGSAEIIACAPPLHREETPLIARAGPAYSLSRGVRVAWRVLGDGFFGHRCICLPDPDYPTPLAQSVKVGSLP